MRKSLAAAMAILTSTLLPGCGGLFESKLAAPQTYVLRLPPTAAAETAAPAGAATLRVQRPEAGPGLNTDLIALLRSDRRFDYYAATRWAAPAPDVLESVVLDALRRTGTFSAVLDDSSPFAPRYNLRIVMRRFEADYSSPGSAGAAPTVRVVLDCTLGRHRDRALLGGFTAQGSAQAAEDRVTAVIAAYEAATAAAIEELTRQTTAAIAADRPASEGR